MNAYGWTWDEFQRTPKAVVEMMTSIKQMEVFVDKWEQANTEATRKK